MKKKHILLAITLCMGLGAGLSSCSDYLSVERFFDDRQSEEKIFKSKKYTEEWLGYCYNRLLDSNLEIARLYYTVSLYADEIIFNETDGPINYRKLKFGQYDQHWTNGSYIRCYEGIRQTSILINNVDINEELSREEIADVKAQGRFLRAYCYWLLLRKYGPVPIMPEETVGLDVDYQGMSYPRSSYDEVADYIASEMALAAKDLPEKRNNLSIARATKGAALATRAKALLFAASPLANGNKEMADFVDDKGRILISQTPDDTKWARAAAAAKDVIKLGDRKVYKLYTAPFKSKGDDIYPATIRPPHHPIYSTKNFPDGWADIDPFESYRAAFNGDLYAAENPELIFTRGTNYINDGVKSIARSQMPTGAGGYNAHGLTAKQCDAYGMADGAPFNLTTCEKGFVTSAEAASGAYAPLREGVWKEYANREPRFYASVAFNGAFWAFASAKDADYRNKQIWYYRGSPEGRTNSSDRWIPTGIGMMKYINPNDCNTNEGRLYDKIDPVIRYADILLIYAEALNELEPGKSYDVTTYDGESYAITRDTREMSRAVSQVRFRGGVPDFDQAVYDDQLTFRKYLKHERQIELMGENQRYFDLRRWKDAPRDEADQIYGCNVLMTKEKAERYYDRVRVENMQAAFSQKMYFWPIQVDELKNNRRMTQAPGWETYD